MWTQKITFATLFCSNLKQNKMIIRIILRLKIIHRHGSLCYLKTSYKNRANKPIQLDPICNNHTFDEVLKQYAFVCSCSLHCSLLLLENINPLQHYLNIIVQHRKCHTTKDIELKTTSFFLLMQVYYMIFSVYTISIHLFDHKTVTSAFN